MVYVYVPPPTDPLRYETAKVHALHYRKSRLHGVSEKYRLEAHRERCQALTD